MRIGANRIRPQCANGLGHSDSGWPLRIGLARPLWHTRIVVAGMSGLLPWQISTSEWLIGLCGLADGPIERKVRRQCP